MKRYSPLLLCILFGCSSNPGLNPDPVSLTGTVTHDGNPLSGVVLHFVPASLGTHERAVNLKDGNFELELNPGEYLIYFSEPEEGDAGSAKQVLSALPETYLQPSEETKITVKADQPLELDISG